MTRIDGRTVYYRVEAWDDVEKIGEGTHTRFIVDEARFYKRFEEKRAKMAQLQSASDDGQSEAGSENAGAQK